MIDPISTMGVRLTPQGVTAAVHAPDAEAVVLCLFDDQDRELQRLPLPERIGGGWHGRFAGIAPGTRYGLRAYGPWDPANGMRFNPAKLLVDPWATAIDRPFHLHPSLFDHDRPNPDDTAPFVPKAIIGEPPFSAGPLPDFDWNRQIIYELHVRGFSKANPAVPEPLRGTFAGLAHPASIAHLQRLGVTTVELMPCAAWCDERHLPALNLSNYWGYNPIAYLAPDPRLAPGGWPEVQAAVAALHQAGIAVILDIVLNHSAESDELGPTLSLRGLDNAGYYRLAEDRRLYVNDAGCGNILALDRPMALRLGMDALRAWAVYGGFDGFRLDLGVTLGRGPNGFDPNGPFLAAMQQDPILSQIAIIAEPWDIGMGGYQLGKFPASWGEWNDHFRDNVRRFWRGDSGMLGKFTTAFAGSSDIFSDRPLTRGINFVTAHDGFTLSDLVSYAGKHNEANGEHNNDGSNDNQSWNNGAEGPSDDPAIQARRRTDIRALLATLLLSHGTPMLSMGDEAGRTQHGNNNAYAQDNDSAWVDWPNADQAQIDHTASLIALRKSLAPLFAGEILQAGDPATPFAFPVVTWRHADGSVLTNWDQPDNRTLIADLRCGTIRAVLAFHAGSEPLSLTLPPLDDGQSWRVLLGSDTATCPARSVAAFQMVADETARRARPTGVADSDVHLLADQAGIEPIWWDIDGTRHVVPLDTKRAILHAMRLRAGSHADWVDSLARLTAEDQGPLPRIVLGQPGAPIAVPLGQPAPRWVTLQREDGSRERFNAGGGLTLPPQPMGRHVLLAHDDPSRLCHLTVAPAQCYLPPDLAAGQRRFGIAAHLYTLRSQGDQGIGDFTTLSLLAKEAAAAGASLVGLNPLHAMFPHDRTRTSPYSPSDRRFLDPIYIDVSGLPGGGSLPQVPGPVDYAAVWTRKRTVLEKAFRTPASIAPALRRFATYQAVAESLGSPDWHRWPDELRHPDSPGVAAFAESHAAQVAFHAFLQQTAEAQLAAAAQSSLSIGFYRDLAVGAAPDGAEAWDAQETLLRGVSVGAPPDPFAQQGQVWSLPPPDPIAMRRSGYAAFNTLLEANMRYAGALRIDHAIGLQRLFVVPEGIPATEGGYISFHRDEMIAQIALQSHRARCLVVGEDLGTVPEGLPERLEAANILSYSVLWFQRRDDSFKPSSTWPARASACVSTHDLPTLAGWWSGADITERHALGLLADEPSARAEREAEKAQLLGQLQTEQLLPSSLAPSGPLPDSVAAAIHGFVARTAALLALVQADDLDGEMVAVNLPGTNEERPNWRRRLTSAVTDLCHSPRAGAILGAMAERSKPGSG